MKKFILLLLLLPLLVNAQITNTMAIGATISTIDAGRGNYVSGIQLEAGISDSLKFQVSSDGTTYSYLKNGDSTLYVLRADSSTSYSFSLDPDKFFAWRYIKVESYDAIAKESKWLMYIREKKR